MRNDSVADGPGALTLLRAAAGRGEPYDLTILDMHMPEMDGLEVARTITADPAIAAVRLVLLTSLGLREIGDDARRAGIATSLTKPVRQSQLYDCLATAVGTPAEPVVEAIPAPDGAARVEARRAAGQRILVAEDNAVNQTVVVRMLQKLGYHADVAASGRLAVEAITADPTPDAAPYAAAFMDCQMPEIDGYAATAAIRAHEGSARRTPIIAMTANALEGDRERCLAAGMDDYIAKPITSGALDTALRRWVTPSALGLESAPDRGVDVVSPSGALDEAIVAGLRALQDEDEPDLLTTLIDMFLAEAKPRLDALRTGLACGDAPSVAREAHALKGSCASIGARDMADLCGELEALGRARDLARAPGLVERLTVEFGRVGAALDAERMVA